MANPIQVIKLTGVSGSLEGKADVDHDHLLADITDAGTAAASDVSAFASAAQGEAAGSALQPADIDTLSELNANFTDGTILVDDGDPRLIDDRFPTAHSHTLSDITDSGTSAALDASAAGDATAGQVVKGDDTRLSDDRTPLTHTHVFDDLTGVAPTVHTHVIADITDRGTASELDAPASGDATAGQVVKGDDTRLSDDRTPLTHTHVFDDLTGVAPTIHTHLIADITDRGTASDLDVAAAGDATAGQVVKGDDTRLSDDRTPLTHTHVFDDLTGVAPTVHNHVIAEITDRGTASELDAPASGDAAIGQVVLGDDTRLSDDRTPLTHTHVFDDLTGVAPTVHTHLIADITDRGTASDLDVAAAGDATAGQVVKGDDTRLSDDRTPLTHTHVFDDLTGVAPTVHTHLIADITDRGTASDLDVAAAGDATAGQVVKGDDTRLSDDRTPLTHTHVFDDLTGVAPTVHNHVIADITDRGTASELDAPASGDATAGQVVLGDDTRLSDDRTPLTHTHVFDDLTGVAPTVHNHVIAEITDRGTASELDAPASGDAAIGQVVLGDDTRLSDDRTPLTHTHVFDDLTGVAPTVHTHLIADITDRGTASDLDVAAAGDATAGQVVKGDDTRLSDDRTPLTHTHVFDDLTGVAPTVHTHVIADITDRGTASELDAPASGDAAIGQVVLGDDTRLSDDRTPLTHTHVFGDLTGVAPTVHTHLIADITDRGTASDLDVAAAGDATAGQVVKGDDTRLSDDRTPLTHTHVFDDLTGVAPTVHTHLIADITDRGTASELDAPASGDAAIGQVVLGDDTRLSDDRTPLTHTHVFGDLTGVAPTVHTHLIADITDRGTASDLDVAAAGDATAGQVVKGDDTRLSDDRTPLTHTHVFGDLTGVAPTVHTHVIADITDRGTASEKDVPASGDATADQVVLGNDTRLTGAAYAPVSHTHVFGDLTGVAPTVHTHVIADITDRGTASELDVAVSGNASDTQVVKGDDTRMDDARTPLTHTHTLADISDSGSAAALNVPAISVDAISTEVVRGDDSRLDDQRVPITHTHTESDISNLGTDIILESDTDISAAGFVLDEIDLVSDSATQLATQSSIKTYVDTAVAATMNYKGLYDPVTNTPNLDASPIAGSISIGDTYTVSVSSGDFYNGEPLNAGDTLIATQDDPTLAGEWAIVRSTQPQVVEGDVVYTADYDASAAAPSTTAAKGVAYSVSAAGTGLGFFTFILPVGSLIIAKVDNPSQEADWIQIGSPVSSITELAEVSAAAVTDKFALMADGAAYVGRALVAADISDLPSSTTTFTNKTFDANGTGNSITNIDLTSDVIGDLPYSNLVPSTTASKLVGRGSFAGAGDMQEISLGTGLTMSGTTISASAPAPSDTVYGVGWNGDTTNAASKNAIYDKIELLDAAIGAAGGGGTTQNVNLSIEPTDDGTTAGNARGQSAVDLQTSRASAAQVASGLYAVIGGGIQNTASSQASTVSGGYKNTASAYYTTISGGYNNDIDNQSQYSSVGGGLNNDLTNAEYGVVGGGSGNLLTNTNWSAVLGGSGNLINTTNAGSVNVVGGGSGNAIQGSYGFIGGGQSNLVTSNSNHAVIAGGNNNGTGSGFYGMTRCFIGAGQNNTMCGYGCFIGAGSSNDIDGFFGGSSNTSIVGGTSNSAYYASNSVVLGGRDCALYYSNYTVMSGRRAKITVANKHGQFIYADDQDLDFVCNTERTANFRVANGMHISAPLFIDERASALADIAGRGQIWVKTATPNELWFTDDAGSDRPISEGVYTVATLPTGVAGRRAFVTDSQNSLQAHHGQTVNGGAANFVPVYYDGAAWLVG